MTPIHANQTQTITITGSGFGTQPPFDGDLPCIQITSTPAQPPTGQWGAGHNGAGGTYNAFGSCSAPTQTPTPTCPTTTSGWCDWVTLDVSSWSDSSITITGFGGQYGDQNQYFDWSLRVGDTIDILIANAQSGAGPADYKLRVT